MDIILEAALDHPCNTLEHGSLEIVDIYRGFMVSFVNFNQNVHVEALTMLYASSLSMVVSRISSK